MIPHSSPISCPWWDSLLEGAWDHQRDAVPFNFYNHKSPLQAKQQREREGGERVF